MELSACVCVRECVLENVGKISQPWQCKMQSKPF